MVRTQGKTPARREHKPVGVAGRKMRSNPACDTDRHQPVGGRRLENAFHSSPRYTQTPALGESPTGKCVPFQPATHTDSSPWGVPGWKKRSIPACDTDTHQPVAVPQLDKTP